MAFDDVIIVVWKIGDIAAGTGVQYPVFAASETLKLKRAFILNDADVAKDTTNYTTISLMNGATSVASKGTNSAAITANTIWDLTLSITKANLKLDAGDVLEFKKADGGTGADLTDATLVMEFYRGYP